MRRTPFSEHKNGSLVNAANKRSVEGSLRGTGQSEAEITDPSLCPGLSLPDFSLLTNLSHLGETLPTRCRVPLGAGECHDSRSGRPKYLKNLGSLQSYKDLGSLQSYKELESYQNLKELESYQNLKDLKDYQSLDCLVSHLEGLKEHQYHHG